MKLIHIDDGTCCGRTGTGTGTGTPRSRLTWGPACVLALSLPHLALAQEQKVEMPKAEELEEIVVVGFRAHLNTVLEQKREAPGVADFVPLGDIGDLPNSNIADTLEHIPGVVGTRFRGTIENLTLRGLPPLLTLSTVNGRELTSKSGDRSVGFRIYPAEFFTGAAVYKSQIASMSEGGIAGTIDLTTPSPLDSEPVLRASGGIQQSPYTDNHELADETGYRGDLFWSTQFALGEGELGVALGFNHLTQPTVNAGGILSPFVALNVRGQDAIVPGTISYSIGAERFRRNGLLGVVEWRSDNGFRAKVDAIAVDADGRLRNNFLQFSGLNVASRYTAATIEGGAIREATLTGLQVTNRIDDIPNENTARMIGANLAYESGNWSTELDLYTSKTVEHRLLSRVVLLTNNVGATVRLSPDEIGVTGLSRSLDNPALYGVNQYLNDKIDVDDEANGVRLGTALTFDDSFFRKVGVGARYTQRHLVSLENIVTNNDVRNAALFPQFAVGRLSPDFFATSRYLDFNLQDSTSGVYPAQFPLLDYDYAIGAMPVASYPVTDTVLLTGSVNNREENLAGYIETDFGAGAMSGTLGVRVVRTDLTAKGYTGNVVSRTDPATGAVTIAVEGLTPATERNAYTKVLPSLNLRFELTPTLQARLSAGRALSRPNFFDQRLAEQLNGGDLLNQPFRGSAGNPQLAPIRSDQADVTLEWYPDTGTAASANVYYKRVKDFVTSSVRNVTIAGLEYQLTSPVNANAGDFYGIEGLLRKDFDFLPAPFDGFGIIATGSYNWTNIDPGFGVLNERDASGAFRYDVESRDPGIEGFARATASGVLWYEKGPVSVRGSARYSSERIRQMSSLNAPLISAERVYVDASASVRVLSNVRVQFTVNNITEVTDTAYYAFRNYTGINQQQGRTFYLGFDVTM